MYAHYNASGVHCVFKWQLLPYQWRPGPVLIERPLLSVYDFHDMKRSRSCLFAMMKIPILNRRCFCCWELLTVTLHWNCPDPWRQHTFDNLRNCVKTAVTQFTSGYHDRLLIHPHMKLMSFNHLQAGLLYQKTSNHIFMLYYQLAMRWHG